MGKRELLLIGGFVLFGMAVYAVTAPAAQPGQAQFSLSKVMEHIRREMRGGATPSILPADVRNRSRVRWSQNRNDAQHRCNRHKQSN